MPHTTLENSHNVGTLTASDGRTARVVYRLRRVMWVELQPEIGPVEHAPEVLLKFPSGAPTIQGPALFTAADGRRFNCVIDGAQAASIGAWDG
jgi:hypothetical protein